VLAALTIAVFQYWGTSQYGTAAASSQGPNQGSDWTQTQWGPLGPADRDLLVMVRQTGLSGGSTGQQAQRQGSNPQVRTVAKRISVDYGDLDNQVRSVASKLGVPLPDSPTTQQQGWMKELSERSGSEYDRMFAQRLRLTDGEVLPAITAVRAGTRNELIRSFAASAAALVNRHMEVLERTGLVDYSRLPVPRPPAAAPPAASAPAGPDQRIGQVVNITSMSPAGSPTGNDTNALVAALVSIAALLVALGLLGTGRRVRRPSGSRQRRHAAHRW
jgi:predicted outer membrane protein